MSEECFDPCPNNDGKVQVEETCACENDAIAPICARSKYCNKLGETSECQNDPAIDCKVSEWTEFSGCTALCGPQTQTRTRSIIHKAANNGKACPILSETKECNLPACPTAEVFCPQDVQLDEPCTCVNKQCQ